MGKKKFAATALNLESEILVVYIGSLNFNALPSSSPLELNVYPFRRPYISSLIAKETSIKVPVKYSDFANVFFPDLASKFSKHIGINNHVIKLVDD